MNTSRRRFLVVLAAGAAAAGAAWLRRGALVRWLFAAPLPPSPTGELTEATTDVLRVAVLALLEDRVDPGHYLECFRWYAAHVRGAREVYERFARAVDARARVAGHAGFRSAPRAVRARLLARMVPARGARQRFRRALFARDEDRFAHHVVRQVFRRWAHTDAYLLAGYGAWQGQPRALVHLPVPGARP